MGLQELSIPICDVFKGDEAFWTERYSGSKSTNLRARIKAYEARTPEDLKELSSKLRQGHLDMSDEAKKAKSEACSKAKRSMSEEASSNRLETFRKTMASRSPEEIEVTRALTSKESKRVWGEKREEIIEAQNRGKKNRTSEAIESMKKQMSESAIAVWGGYNFDQKNTRVSNQYRRSKGPNSPELFLGIYLGRKFPGEWAFNGQKQAGFVIAGKVPDYVNINGKKAVAEVFGIYWHPEENEETWKALYRSVGYECFVVWEYDVCNEEVLDKIFGVTI